MLIEPRKALNKAFLKIKPNRSGIELFKQNLILLLDSIKEKESEEFHKNLISDFLKNTYYSPNHFINTKGRNDLVIHIGKEAKSNVGVIIEAKSPSNKSEMISQKGLNSKALQEMVLYFLRERITHKNLEVKNVVATNVNEWYIFDAQLFDKLFAQNKSLVKQFQDFEEGKLSGKNTDFFYKEIAKPYIETVLDKLEYTYFDLATYDKILRNSDKLDDAKLIVLYKLLSPEHLLKLSFANDSNSLDKNFYNELLHLIGLTETKEGGKKLIERPKSGHRNAGSLLENVINQLDSLDKLSRLPNVKQYGDTHEERLFTVGLELCITWVNRILFLKLLEAQLISYHKGDKSYAFLHKGLLHDYDNLNALFFMVLAKKPEERNERVKTLFAKVPYLNSSLFEPTELEHQTLFIAGLEDDIPLQLLGGTVIKDTNGKKLTGTHKSIDYFFDFLDAYDFASEGSEEIQEDNKTLINASVLGLIFEKINGYKDGSFYTPSFITMYMCKETIRRAVVQKFNETKGWNCEDFDALYNKIEDAKEANTIINSVKICDPAVGSGHFLVSALNEMIAIKHDLKVLVDREGKRLKEYQVDIVNDELIVTDEDGVPFSYNPKSKESQRLQETLFHEKQTIIENCLFGVDINPNSVKICRLRLWIELLKNAYYRNETELETLPNIDINIKCGNSLISRFELDADLKEALKKSKLKIEDYKRAVDQYRNAESKEQKREMETLIAEIKNGFSSNIDNPFKDKIKKTRWEVNKYETEINTKEQWGEKIEKSLLKEFEISKKKFQKLEQEQEEIKSNKIYENAFEWRFEFPEVLNDEGDFVGFDVVIGNPPYVFTKEGDFSDLYKTNISKFFEKYNVKTESKGLNIQTGKINLFGIFLIRSYEILKKGAEVNVIIPNNILRATTYEAIRKFLIENTELVEIVDLGNNIFEDATVATVLLSYKKNILKDNEVKIIKEIKNFNEKEYSYDYINQSIFYSNVSFTFNILLKKIEVSIIDKMLKNSESLEKYFRYISPGIDGDKDKFVKKEIFNHAYKPLLYGKDFGRYIIKFNSNYIEYDRNKLNRAREEEIFLSNKILIQRISGGLMPLTCTIDYDNYYTFNSVNNLVLKEDSEYCLEFFLGLLNSKLLNWFYSVMFSNKSTLTVNISKTFLIELPIKTSDDSIITNLVTKILTLKKDNPEADTYALEREIDVMVYALYGLSEEEIEIMENS